MPFLNEFSFNDITPFDYIIGLIFLIFMIRGVWVGFLRQLTTFLALVGSYWVSAQYSSQLMPYIQPFLGDPKLVFLASFGAMFMVSALVFILAGKVLHRVMEITLLGWFDRVVGLLFGVLKAAITVVLLYMVMASSLSPSNHLFQGSITVPWLEEGAILVRDVIQDPDVKKAFMPRKPAIDKPAVKKADSKKQVTSKTASDNDSKN